MKGLRQCSGMHMVMGSNADLAKLDFFYFYVHRHVILYIADIYMLYALCEQVCTRICMCIHVYFCIYMFEHCMYWNNVFSNVYKYLYMQYTLHIQAIHNTYLSVHGSSWFIPRTWNIIAWLKYCLEVYHCLLVCTALEIGMYYAIIQESAVGYIQVSAKFQQGI